jgi:hypothetical protein
MDLMRIHKTNLNLGMEFLYDFGFNFNSHLKFS